MDQALLAQRFFFTLNSDISRDLPPCTGLQLCIMALNDLFRCKPYNQMSKYWEYYLMRFAKEMLNSI